MNEVDIPNHPDAVCSLHGIPCRATAAIMEEHK